MPLSSGLPRLERWLTSGPAPLRFTWLERGLLLGGFFCAFYLLPWPEPLLASAFLICTIIIVRSDLAFYLIPDGATFSLAGFGLLRGALSSFSPDLTLSTLISALWPHAASGILGFGLFFAVGWIYERLTGREGLGFGDVKLAGALGLWLAPGDFAIALELAAFTAFLLILWQARKGENLRFAQLPLGAFLAPAGFIVYFASSFTSFGLPGTRF